MVSMQTAVFGTWHNIVWQKCTNDSEKLAMSSIRVHKDSSPFECYVMLVGK